jgi:hypothetical protein
MNELFAAAIEPTGEKWLLDPELLDVWRRLDQWLCEVPPTLRENAAAYIVGGLAGPSWLIARRGEDPAKREIVRDIRAAHAKLRAAAEHLRKAAGLIQEAQKTTSILPDAAVMLSSHRLGKLPDDDPAGLLRLIAKDLEMEPILAGSSLAVQKAGWRDWLREAADAMQEAGEMYGVDVPLREKDWVALARAATGHYYMAVSRASVSNALCRIKNARDL